MRPKPTTLPPIQKFSFRNFILRAQGGKGLRKSDNAAASRCPDPTNSSEKRADWIFIFSDVWSDQQLPLRKRSVNG